MNETPRVRRSIKQLLKVAHIEANALRVDLADIERARQAAEDGIKELDRQADLARATAAKNESPVTASAIDAAQDGIRARRHNLQTTLLTLGEAEEKIRASLQAAFVEVGKLEQLIKINDRADKKILGEQSLSEMADVDGDWVAKSA